MTDSAEILRQALRRDRYRAHELIFGDYHEDPSPAAHRDLVNDYWSTEERLIILGFRGFAKSSRAEEYVAIAACEKLFRTILFIGPSEARAVDRLTTVTNFLKACDPLLALYGDQIGEVTSQTKLILRNGVALLAMGRGQDIRGLKQLVSRPDLIIVDDFEDKENVLTEDGRRNMLRWFLRELRMACQPRAKFRILSTLMHQRSVPVQLRDAGWPTKVYPISYLDRAGEERATWSARFPLSWIERERMEYARLGQSDLWQLEMMCSAEGTEETKVFKPEMIRIEPRERRWEAVYAMIDPARTTNRQSSTTGWAVWSWIRADKFIVWEAGAKRLMPSEVLELAFRINREYDPVEIGIEENGLNEWLSEPMRARMRADGVVIPYRAVGAPRGKLDFIGGLQAYFEDSRGVFARELPELRDQLLRFPHPPIDAPNALAYAILLRAGPPVYEGFRDDHISLDLQFHPWRPSWLAANARDGWTTVVLCQLVDERVSVLLDWAWRGAPDEHLGAAAADAGLLASGHRLVAAPPSQGWDSLKIPDSPAVMVRTKPQWVAPEWHWDRWVNVGLEQAIRRLPAMPQRGGPLGSGRDLLARKLELMRIGTSLVQVSEQAKWTLRAFAGGYARSKTGIEPETGVYRCLMEGVEAWLALASMQPDDEEEQNYSYDRHGRRYVSAMPARH